MNKIPTVEKFLKNFNEKEGNLDKLYYDSYVKKLMTKFAKLHVEAALKAASENVIIYGYHQEYNLDKDLILNAYPLENIK